MTLAAQLTRSSKKQCNEIVGNEALPCSSIGGDEAHLLLAILEVGAVYFTNFQLEAATAQGARLIRTGQAQAQSFNAAKFNTEVCKHVNAPITCSALMLDVRHYSSFSGAGADLTNPVDANGNLKTNFTYDPGVGGDVIVARAFYEWNLTAKQPKDIALSNMNNGDRLRVARVVFATSLSRSRDGA